MQINKLFTFTLTISGICLGIINGNCSDNNKYNYEFNSISNTANIEYEKISNIQNNNNLAQNNNIFNQMLQESKNNNNELLGRKIKKLKKIKKKKNNLEGEQVLSNNKSSNKKTVTKKHKKNNKLHLKKKNYDSYFESKGNLNDTDFFDEEFARNFLANNFKSQEYDDDDEKSHYEYGDFYPMNCKYGNFEIN